jgi:hypothetical protein
MKPYLNTRFQIESLLLKLIPIVLWLGSCSDDNVVNPNLIFRIDEIESIHIQGVDENRRFVGIDLDNAKREKWVNKLRGYTIKGDGGNTFFGNMYLTLKSGEIKEISMYSKGPGCNVWNAEDYNGSLVIDGFSYIPDKARNN